MHNQNEFSKGSEWRKWDLHLHPPGTKLNDNYKVDQGNCLDEFCQKLENSDVNAFGITDYFSAEGYFAFIEKFKEKYPESKKIFFPNVELRTSDVVNKAQEEVNMHIIFNPFQSEIESSIKTFLQYLKTNKTAGGGKNITASELKIKNDFESATTTREFIRDAFKNTFGDKADLSEYLLVFTSANNDGIRSERGKKRKAAITDEVDKFSNGFFGNSNNIKYFLDTNRLEEKDEKIDAKPVVSGCDAHSFDDLDNWLGRVVVEDSIKIKEPTWIKADLTFEGLRQIIYEPDCRVYIGEEPDIEIRVHKNPTKFIKSLHIKQIDGYNEHHGIWFKDEVIDLNKEMVAIIGNKGSGKSAVTDILGLLGDSHNQFYENLSGISEELFSFLNSEKFHKNNCSSNFFAELLWYDGNPVIKTLDTENDKNNSENVEYLPQKYLEKICSNIDDDEFRKKLNEVIFGYVEDKDRFDNQDFESLVKYRTKQVTEDIKILKNALNEQNEKIVTIEKKLTRDYRKEIEEKLKHKQEEVDAHQNIKPDQKEKPQSNDSIDNAEVLKIEQQISDLDTEIVKIEAEQTVLSKEVEDLRQAKETIVRQVEELTNLKPKFEKLFSEQGFSFEDIVVISTKYEKLDGVINNKDTRLKEIIGLLKTEEEIKEQLPIDTQQIEFELKVSLRYKISQLLVKKKEKIDLLDKPQRDYQNYLKQLKEWEIGFENLNGDTENPTAGTLNWYKQELEKIKSDYLVELENGRIKRNEISERIFIKKMELISFYDSIKEPVDKEIIKHGKDLGDYNVSIESSLRFDPLFYKEFFTYVNQQVKGSFQGIYEGETSLKKLARNVNWQNQEAVFSFLYSIVEHLDYNKKDSSDIDRKDIFRQMKQYKDPIEFYNYLYGLDFLQTKYDLKVDNKDLSELSSGERGGLLLIFYLMLDTREIPLIIDQPEDNLDNQSVYKILVTFLKKAKKHRQIILVTHNPNLAVVADAEQIIHVSIDKKNNNDFSFISGSIENPLINKKVVDILEGTRPAFDNRRIKYRKESI